MLSREVWWSGGQDRVPGADRDRVTPEERRARELRLIGREMREDEEWAAAELDAAQRSFAEALAAAATTGHDVTIDTVAGSRRGRIVHLGEDVIGLASVIDGRVDIAAQHVLGVAVSRRPGSAASISTGHPRTVVARLREAVQDERTVILERLDASTVRGVVAAVGIDHVVVRSGEDDVLVPTEVIVSIGND